MGRWHFVYRTRFSRLQRRQCGRTETFFHGRARNIRFWTHDLRRLHPPNNCISLFSLHSDLDFGSLSHLWNWWDWCLLNFWWHLHNLLLFALRCLILFLFFLFFFLIAFLLLCYGQLYRKLLSDGFDFSFGLFQFLLDAFNLFTKVFSMIKIVLHF